jgi:hypothetical protein
MLGNLLYESGQHCPIHLSRVYMAAEALIVHHVERVRADVDDRRFGAVLSKYQTLKKGHLAPSVL